MTNKEYREHEGISRSELFAMTKSPLHFKYNQDHPEEEKSPALSFGAAAHKMILEPKDFDAEYAVCPKVDRRTKEGKDAYATFIQKAEGREVVSEDDYKKIKAMQEAISSYKEVTNILYSDNAKYEQSFFWVDAETGEAVKCRPDCISEYLGKKYIIDYKTTDSCQDGHFERSVRKYGYKLQAGMYREGVFQNTLDDCGFMFIAQEKEAPYAVRVYVCTEGFIEEGYDQYRELLGMYHWCKTHDNWYGYEGVTGGFTDLVGEGDLS